MSELSDPTSRDGGARAPARPVATTYRTPPVRPAPRVIRTSHLSRRWWLIVWVGLSVVFLFSSSRTQLVCERDPGGGICVITNDSLRTRGEPRRVPIAELTGARVEEDADTSGVVLLTRSGDIPLPSSPRWIQLDEKKAMASAVSQLVHTPAQARLEATYGSVWADYFPAWVAVTLIAVAFLHFTRALGIVVDTAEGVICVQRPTFPWGRETKTWPLASVIRAEVEEDSGGDRTYRIALRFAGGTTEPLTDVYSSGRTRKARAVDEINAALPSPPTS